MTYLGKPNNADEIIEWDGTKFITASIIVSGSEFNEWTDGGNRMVATASISIHSTGLYANQMGSNNYFFSSGSKFDNLKTSVFGGDVHVSGNMLIGTTHVLTGTTATNSNNFIGGGVTNTISSSIQSSIIAGTANIVRETSTNAIIAGGTINIISASLQGSIVGGNTNTIKDTSTNSIIAGGITNLITSSIRAAIVGGSANSIINDSSHAGIFAGGANSISASTTAVIVGGITNTLNAASTNGAILGGTLNIVSASSQGSIVGGSTNVIKDVSGNSAIIGGFTNTISGTVRGVIAGGNSNSILIAASHAGIFAGSINTISASQTATIIGGQTNTIKDSSTDAIIAGGTLHIITSSADATIAGGASSAITGSAQSSILGGNTNNISGSARATIIGGLSNIINATSTNSVILGGTTNKISSSTNSVIIGGSSNTISESANSSILIGTGLVSNVANSIILGGSNYQIIVSGGLTGSLQRTIGGKSYIIGGNNITVNTNSLGQVEITGSVGAGNWVEGSPSPRLRTSASLSISSDALFAQNYGSNIFFYVSGSKYTNTKTAGFGGDVYISGSIIVGTNQIIKDSSDYATIIGGYDHSIISSSVNSMIIGGNGSIISGASNVLIIGATPNSYINNVDSGNSMIIGGNSSYIVNNAFSTILNTATSYISGTSLLDGAFSLRTNNSILGGAANAIDNSQYSALVNSVFSEISGYGSADTSGINVALNTALGKIHNSQYAVIINGSSNTITNSFGSMILGLGAGSPSTIINSTNSLIVGEGITCQSNDTILLGSSTYKTIISGGLTGSLQKTINGNAYISAGPGINVTTNSLQQIEITSSTVPLLGTFPSYGTMKYFSMWTDFFNTVQGLVPFTANANNGGASQVGTATAGRFGIARQATLTSQSGSVCYSGGVSSIVFGSGVYRFRTDVLLSAVSDGTNTFGIRLGFNDCSATVPVDAVDGVYFRYTDSVNSGKWQCVARSNSAESALDSEISGSAVTASYQTFEIEVNNVGTTASYYINGTNVANVTASIPTGITRATGINCHISKSAGNTSRTLDYDCLGMLFIPTTPL